MATKNVAEMKAKRYYMYSLHVRQMELACTLTQRALATNDAVCDCDDAQYTTLCRPCLFLNKWK